MLQTILFYEHYDRYDNYNDNCLYNQHGESVYDYCIKYTIPTMATTDYDDHACHCQGVCSSLLTCDVCDCDLWLRAFRWSNCWAPSEYLIIAASWQLLTCGLGAPAFSIWVTSG